MNGMQGQAAVPANEPEINEMVQFISNQLGEVEDISGVLEKRIEACLIEKDQDAGSQNPMENKQTSLGQELYVIGNRIAKVRNHLRDLVNRCEL